MTMEARDGRRWLGATIAAARGAAGLTQEGLGRSTGLGQTVISRIESGQRRVAADELGRLARALGVDVAALIGVGVERAEEYEERLRRLGDPALAEELAWVAGFVDDLERLERMDRGG